MGGGQAVVITGALEQFLRLAAQVEGLLELTELRVLPSEVVKRGCLTDRLPECAVERDRSAQHRDCVVSSCLPAVQVGEHQQHRGLSCWVAVGRRGVLEGRGQFALGLGKRPS
jgi:hypothetical protein